MSIKVAPYAVYETMADEKLCVLAREGHRYAEEVLVTRYNGDLETASAISRIVRPSK